MKKCVTGQHILVHLCYINRAHAILSAVLSEFSPKVSNQSSSGQNTRACLKFIHGDKSHSRFSLKTRLSVVIYFRPIYLQKLMVTFNGPHKTGRYFFFNLTFGNFDHVQTFC